MPRLNDYFDKVVCISLKEREDKRKEQQEKFDKLGIEVEWFTPPKYEFIPNLIKYLAKTNHTYFNPHQPYEIGAALSHYTVMKEALLEGVEKLFVFEDDVLFQKDFNTKLEKYMNKVPEDWQLLLFYSFIYDILPQHRRISSRWITSYKAWSLMSYSITSDLMQEYIKKQDSFFTISDMVTYRMQEEGYKIYSAVPTLTIPNSDLGSDIRKIMNYENKQTIINMGFGKENYE